MPISSRERVILSLAAIMVGVFLLDRLILTPAWQWRQDLADRRVVISHDLSDAAAMIDHHALFERQWKEMTRSSLSTTISDAEGIAYHAVRDWAQVAGLNLLAINPERVNDDSTLPIVVFRTTGTGPMRAVATFLKQLDETTIALHIEQLQIISRRDGQDDLTLELRLSTILDPTSSPSVGWEKSL